MIRIRVLGPAEAEVGGGPADLGSRRQRAVLAVLTSHRGRAVSSDRLIEDVWHGNPPQRPLISVHAYVSHLRRVLEPHRPPRAPASVLLSSAQGYCLRLPTTPSTPGVSRTPCTAPARSRRTRHGRPCTRR
ncbi:hypothetical protein B1R27_30745 [Streptomyces sp. GKU 895]|nr:hypothetical protein B1R27_30745 [Streptomyces sp. GKU 895]